MNPVLHIIYFNLSVMLCIIISSTVEGNACPFLRVLLSVCVYAVVCSKTLILCKKQQR